MFSICLQQSLDEKINETFASGTDWFVDAILAEIPITDTVGIPWVLVILFFGALFFTVYFRFINFRDFFTAIQVVRGKFDHLEVSDDTSNDTAKNGEVSHFQALTTAVSATVGLGNIAGVAIALSIGGGWSHVMDDIDWFTRDVIKVCRVYFGGKI